MIAARALPARDCIRAGRPSEAPPTALAECHERIRRLMNDVRECDRDAHKPAAQAELVIAGGLPVGSRLCKRNLRWVAAPEGPHPSCSEPSHDDIALAGTSRTRVVRTLMPFSTDPWTMHPATSATWCSMRIAGTRTDRQGGSTCVSIVSATTRRATDRGRRPGSFNALINAPA